MIAGSIYSELIKKLLLKIIGKLSLHLDYMGITETKLIHRLHIPQKQVY